jgi:phospholipid/cholesterol/gamma-HCH transport system substrate-binding protein
MPGRGVPGRSRGAPIRPHGKQLAITCVVLGVAVLAASVVGMRLPGPMLLRACFGHAGGLRGGDPVLLSGVEVGSVASVDLDAEQRACALLHLRRDLRLDRDTSAAIFTVNVMGDKYIALEPGGDEELLASGEEIHYTQSALSLERIMIRLLERQLGTSFD